MRYCDKLDVCDDETDRSGCVQKCTDDAIRADAYFEARASCVEERSCNLWWREVTTMGVDDCDETKDTCSLDDCTKDTLAARPASDEERAYCGQVVSKLNAARRSRTADVERRCLSLAPTLSSGYLAAWQQCVALPCEQLPTCIEAVLDRFNTDLTFMPIMSVPPTVTR